MGGVGGSFWGKTMTKFAERMTLDEWIEFNHTFRYMGMRLFEIRQAVVYARNHGWVKPKDPTENLPRKGADSENES